MSITRPPDARLVALKPFDLVLTTLWGECRGESVEGQVAVANVLRNRLKDRRWGDNYHDVLLDWAEFDCLWPSRGGLNFTHTMGFATRINDQHHYSLRERQLRWITQGLFADSIVDNVHGATHYFGTYIAPPFWAVPPGRRVATIGRHEFWAGVK